MTKLLECSGCTRHVRVDDGRCPFCGRASTISAPARVLALVLPLTLMACSGGESPAAGKPGDAKPAEVKPAPVEPTPVVVDPVPVDDGGAPQPSVPADDGAEIDEPTIPDDRIMTTKYGGPPAMDGPRPVVEPAPAPDPETRPARKYGAPPPPIDPRPAKKYGAPPKPDPLG